MADVQKVASLLIDLANSAEDDSISNLKLNKLLYFAHGICLARTGKPLFSNPVEAWPKGPVIAEIYHTYKGCGRMPIGEAVVEYSTADFTEAELEAILDAAREYGQYTGNRLVTITHMDGTPWKECVGGFISNEAIEEYFREHEVPRFVPRMEIVQVLPAEWYDPAEDAEWEAYLK